MKKSDFDIETQNLIKLLYPDISKKMELDFFGVGEVLFHALKSMEIKDKNLNLDEIRKLTISIINTKAGQPDPA